MSSITPQERHAMIQEAAYFLAENNGFAHGQEESYWLMAEQEVTAMLERAGIQIRGGEHEAAAAAVAASPAAKRRPRSTAGKAASPATAARKEESSTTSPRARGGSKKKAVPGTAKP